MSETKMAHDRTTTTTRLDDGELPQSSTTENFTTQWDNAFLRDEATILAKEWRLRISALCGTESTDDINFDLSIVQHTEVLSMYLLSQLWMSVSEANALISSMQTK